MSLFTKNPKILPCWLNRPLTNLLPHAFKHHHSTLPIPTLQLFNQSNQPSSHQAPNSSTPKANNSQNQPSHTTNFNPIQTTRILPINPSTTTNSDNNTVTKNPRNPTIHTVIRIHHPTAENLQSLKSQPNPTFFNQPLPPFEIQQDPIQHNRVTL